MPRQSQICSGRCKLLSLVIGACLLLLPGCQSVSVPQDCPQVVIPETLAQSDSPSASDFSERVSSYLLKVQDWLNGSQPGKTQ